MFFRYKGRRRRKPGPWSFLTRLLFHLNPQHQYMMIVISAIAMAALVFSGLLLFRQSDHGDLLTHGQWLMRQGKMALAVQEFEKLVERHPKSYQGHLLLGNAYLEIGEFEQAANEYRFASRLRSRNLKESGAHIAMARLLIAQRHFDDAEKQLIQALKAHKKGKEDPELYNTMVALYDKWGDFYLNQKDPDYENAFLKYSTGLRYVKSHQQQETLQEKLLTTAQHVADTYVNNKEYDKAIAVLKRSLRYDRDVDTMISIATIYEKKKDLDHAIKWNRKAYQIAPEIISLKLSNLLLQKGQELKVAHQDKQAEELFKEAQSINQTVRLPVNKLFPVRASNLKVNYDFNASDYEIHPTISFTVANDGEYPLRALTVKALFSSGGIPFSDTQVIVTQEEKPLSPRGQPGAKTTLKIKAPESIPVEDLEEGKLHVQLMMSYSEQGSSKWFDLKQVETYIPESRAHLNPTQPTAEGDSA